MAIPTFDERRLLEDVQHEKIEDRTMNKRDRHDEAKEQEGDLGIGAAEACHGQLRLRGVSVPSHSPSLS